jgi:uncharacterized protein YkwD
MFTHHNFNMKFFQTVLVLIIFSGYATLCSGQQLPDNIIDTTLTWINQARTQKGLKIISIDPKLNKIAKTHSKNMIEHNLLSDSNPALGTPFERMQSSGLTDTNNLVAVARAKTWDLLREQLKAPENLPKILSSEMTHVGIGMEQDSTGDLWLTIHMTERAINFTQYTLNQSNDIPASRSIKIKGNTRYKKVEVILIPPEDSNPDLAVDRVIIPNSSGNFETVLTFKTETGTFEFEFYVQIDGTYELKNFFSMDI